MLKRLILAALAAATVGLCPLAALATVTTTTSSITYSASGTTGTFTVPYAFNVASDLVVTDNGATKTLGTDYTVSCVICTSGATVTFTVNPLAGHTIVLTRAVPYTQLFNPSAQGKFSPPAYGHAFDTLEMQVQQLVSLPVTGDLTGTLPSPTLAPSGVAAGTYGNATNVPVLTLDAKGRATSASMTPVFAAGTTTNYTAPFTSATTRASASKLADFITVADFLPVGYVTDGSVDYTTQIQTAITRAAGKKLSFCPAATYKFSSQLVFTGLTAVDFCGSSMSWAGPVGVFAMVLDSTPGSGTTGTAGTTYDNLTLYQSDFTAYTTATGSATFDPPSIASGSAISNATPGGASTTVTATGATVGGYARATFSNAADGIELTARVTAPGTVTVTFSNYSNAAIDLASGTLSVTVVNNAYHGLCLSGSLGRLRNAKVRGFTGVSVAMGTGTSVVSGVTLPGLSNAFYWKTEMNITPAAGWGFLNPPRNNENEFTLGFFPANFYNENPPRRAGTINQVVIGGLTNKFHRMSMEATSSEESFILLGSAGMNETTGVSYVEYNTSWVTPPNPFVRAKPFSSANRFRFRIPYAGKTKVDNGTGNEIVVLPAASVNGQQILLPSLGRNLVTNGDFENGLTGWSDFSTAGTFAVSGTGAISGKRIHADFVAGRPNLSQTIDTASGLAISGLIGQNVTCSAFIKTNIANVKPRINGATGNTGTVGDSTDEYLSVTYMVPTGTASLPVVFITDASGLTGFVEVSNVTCFIVTQAGAIGERTQPVGSKTFDPPSIAATAQTSTTVTVTGAALGDFANCSFSLDLALLQLTGYVNAADTVTCLFQNGTAGAIDLLSGTLRARVVKQ